jgi:hypothetical protein
MALQAKAGFSRDMLKGVADQALSTGLGSPSAWWQWPLGHVASHSTGAKMK